jgi:methylmalonyl-CoA mutase cobalamin-binding domain/chain
MYKNLSKAIEILDLEKAKEIVRDYLDQDVPVIDIIESSRIGVEMVGQRYQRGDYFLADLVMSEAILKEITDLVEPFLPAPKVLCDKKVPHIILGTIQGDIHDLGKNIVIYLLRSSGYRVKDLGVDVPIAKFIEEARDTDVKIIGICFLLTNCIKKVKELIDTFEKEGLRDGRTLIIGGYAADEGTCNYVRADYCASTTANIIPLFDSIINSNR